MSDVDPMERTKARLQARVRAAVEKSQTNLRAGESLDPTTGEIQPPPGEVRLALPPVAKRRLKWLDPQPDTTYILTHDGVFCVEASRVLGKWVYTAWKRSSRLKWLLGATHAGRHEGRA